MNKKPILFRWVVAGLIVAIFAFSIYPLKPLDFYVTLEKLASSRLKKYQKEKKVDLVKKFDETITLAKQIEAKDKVYSSTAVEMATRKLGTDLKKYIVLKGSTGNKDILGWVKGEAASSIRLGIDLNGGVEFLLKIVPQSNLKDSEGKVVKTAYDKQRDAAIEVLRNRLESENIFEAEISPVGGELVSLKVPTVSKEENKQLLELLKMSARLEFRAVHPENDKLVTEFLRDPEHFKTPPGYKRMEMIRNDDDSDSKKRVYFVKVRFEMRGKGNIAEAFPTLDSFGQRMIILHFTPTGAQRFADVTTRLTGKLLAIVLDGTLYSAPVIQQAITGGNAQISGSFSREEANRISKALMSGNLPKIKVEAMFQTAPTLGREAVDKGMRAGVYGLILVILFMFIYYRRAGIVADIALLVNVVLIMGFMATFQATLTLPGIAGIVLTIGMAVDANVLIYERIREELDRGKNLLTAIDLGYERALWTIIDANVTTLLVALILIWQGSGPVKGFAVTLAIGIVTSVFTALFLTRLVFDSMNNWLHFKKMHMMRFFSKTSFDFIGMRNIAIGLSSTMILLSIIIVGYKGTSVLGIDFTGGTRITYNYETTARPLEGDIAKFIEKQGYDVKVSYKSTLIGNDKGDKLELVLRKRGGDSASAGAGLQNELSKKLMKRFPNLKITSGNEITIGGLIGWQFTKAAITAIVMALIGIVIYISFRFEFAFAIASIIALLHDITIATGIFVLTSFFMPGSGIISLPVIAALLTILGYSINDTIVVFDRIREDLKLIENKSYKDIINISINQTLSRTVLTSMTTLIVLLTMYCAGVAAINDFILVMIIGVVVGTYSSIFIAS
ncbi:MAG: protein translocase subunit SecD, partial [Victivallales bacterium]|nr:protein translocase subunit SecD [Victivallales bacterium]